MYSSVYIKGQNSRIFRGSIVNLLIHPSLHLSIHPSINYGPLLCTCWASLVAQRLKRLPAMLETWVRSLGREGPLEKEMATHSSILAWRIPWTGELGGLSSTVLQRVGHD